jgi:Enterobacterial TraT complement resistance protein
MIRHGELNTRTEMSESVFLELRSDLPQTVYVSEASTAGRELTVRPTLDRQLMDAGYTVVDAPAEATYIVQINYLRLSEVELTGDQTVKDAIEGAFYAGAGAAIAADILGASGLAAEIGLAVGVVAFLLDAKTKHIAHMLTTDVFVTETIPDGAGGTEVQYHETQIVSGASKINLDLERGLPAMIGGLSRSLAGLLPTRARVLADPSP